MADQSILVRCRDALVGLLKAKRFVPLPNGSGPAIMGQKAADVLQSGLPCILVTLEGMTDNPSGKAWAWPDKFLWGHGIAVTVMDHAARGDDSNTDLYMGWRETAETALLVPTLEGVPELWRTKIESGERIERQLRKDIKTPEYMRLASGFIVRCLCIRKRG